MGIRFLTFCLLAILSISVDSRPVSYPGGYTLMTKADNFQNSVYMHYSPTYKYAIGIERKKDKRRIFCFENYFIMNCSNKNNQNSPIILEKMTFNVFLHNLTTRKTKHGKMLSLVGEEVESRESNGVV